MIAFNSDELKVLLVEDNENFRRLIRTILQSLGISCIREEEDGAAGLAALEEYEADLVIVDYRMAPMNGLDFTRRLRRSISVGNACVPVLMVTGYAGPRLLAQARDVGVNEFLAKPVSARMLMSRIVQVLQSPRTFVSAPDYVGPDRRRRQAPIAHAERRHAV
jgi:CheY-like chemotaxis protein